MDKKKLLFFHQSLAPYRLDLWNRLATTFNFQVYFVYDNLLNQKFDQQALRSKLNFEPGYLSSGMNVGNRAVRWGFSRILKKQRPDIVCSYEYSQVTVFLYLIKTVFRKKYKLLTMCDDSLQISKDCKGVRKMARSFLAKRLDGIILVDQRVADYYRDELGVKGELIVLPILAKEDGFRENLQRALPLSNQLIEKYNLGGKKLMFFVGRLVPVKGIDCLFDAFRLVYKKYPEAMLVLVGDGELKDQLRTRALELDIAPQVLFAGRSEGEALFAWFNLAQVMVLPSHYEPFGAVVNELMLAGARILCSQYAGASSIVVNDVNGQVFDPADIKAFAAILEKYFDSIVPATPGSNIRPSRMLVNFNDCTANLENKLLGL